MICWSLSFEISLCSLNSQVSSTDFIVSTSQFFSIMPKRHLAIQNKGHEQQSSTVLTRSSSKRVNTNESIPVKKPKTEDEYIDKENVPKRQSRQVIKPKQPEPLPPPIHVKIVEPEPEKSLNPTDDEDDEVEDEEEEHPISSTSNDDGKDHPTNKQYVIYESTSEEPLIISKTARYWNMKYRKVLRNVNPDAFGIYIHNDFSCYGELEVIENCLLDLTKAIFVEQQGLLARFNPTRKPENKINYILAFRRLEALTILLDYTDGISGIDDGDRFYDIMRVIGACYVTILRGLLPKFMFGKIGKVNEDFVKKLKKISKQIPNFKQVLERALTIGHMFVTIADVCTAYTNILQVEF
jgi:hypothetical protein